jgi:hypothetical protein
MLKVEPLGAETRETSICLALVVTQIMSTVKKKINERNRSNS